ncbi:aldo/keto reductase [Phytohabitans sp. ZYX-F-186]|uniref:Aldo/keto reductase n=1 Tax=Phytohabitans maris TaxID=3071409 RepID=A0ABU0ZP94_9ACTN|nr:aldo/keto reductase [Phytohabitans sp. ZYX-F-186]MDQ7908847.1 aldo/keto reductase [Phytohabitans sp. ZYX-F-186]
MTQPTVSVADRVEMPLLGFGTWQLPGRQAYEPVRVALETGYRHLDTATMYRNESEVGRALRDSGVPRGEVFLTTKLPAERAGRERETIEASLKALGVDRLDLWLVHWPPAGSARPGTWREFVAARDEGLTRAIGVSNYSIGQIDELTHATAVTPAVNQIPYSPALHDPKLVAEHRERGVVLEGYSPFRRSDLREPVLAEVAAAHGVAPTHVILRWHIQHGIVVIPKSATPERIRSNFEVSGFTLSDEEMARIDAIR